MATRPIHIMVIGTHPADVFDQAGGTIAHHVAQGDKVTALVVTTGAYSHDWETIDKKRRRSGKLEINMAICYANRKYPANENMEG